MSNSDWSVEKACQLYNIAGWGAGYFNINQKGHLVAHPFGQPGDGPRLVAGGLKGRMDAKRRHLTIVPAGCDVYSGGDFSVSIQAQTRS